MNVACRHESVINIGHLNAYGERTAEIGTCIYFGGHAGSHRHLYKHVVIGLSGTVMGAIRAQAELLGYASVAVGPHAFRPLRRWRNQGRCEACMVHESLHPTGPVDFQRDWFPARPMWDKTAAFRV